jgi:ribonuclease D
LVQTQALLDTVVGRLREAKTFAYDTEFIGEMSYRPNVCLIQVATDDYVGLIDPLSGIDLTPFWELMCDPALFKIAHAGEQDLEHVWRALGQAPTNVFDTQVAAGFIGLSYPASLAKLVGEFLGIKLAKGFTFTDWTLRPLSGSQLKYAADDVRFLPTVTRLILEKLEKLDRVDWAMQECERRCVLAEPGFDAEQDWDRVRGSGSLDGRGVNVLKQLITWREACAETADVPPRTFLKDEVLIDIIRARPKITERLSSIRHLPRPVIEHHGKDILELVARGLEMPPMKLDEDSSHEPNLTEKFRYDSVWAVVQTLCAAQGLDSAMVTSRQETIDVFRALVKRRDVSQHRLLSGWRDKAVGHALKDIAAGKFNLPAEWTGDTLRLEPR